MKEDSEFMEQVVGVEKRDIASLEYVSKLSEFVDLHEFLQDDDLIEMLDLALKCLSQPHLKAETARNLLVKFQAASTKFGMLATIYTTLRKGKAGTDDNMKKNIYYSASDLCDKMAASLKYIVRRDNVTS